LTSGRSGGQDGSLPAKPGGNDSHGPVELLSDTKGFNMKPYLKDLVARVRTTWFMLIPNTVRAPILAQGHLSIDFRLMKDGHIEEIKYHEKSGNESLDRAAYGAITGSSPMAPLPAEFQCQFVRIRFYFYYNQSPGDIKERSLDDQVLPCVTSKVELADEAPSKVTPLEKIPLVVAPTSIQLAPGAKARFYAKIYGLVDSAVAWSVRGSGCERSACGIISSDGLYTAPDNIPNPPVVTVIATSIVTPTNSASSTITIAAAGDSH